jgi:hypothetical protein
VAFERLPVDALHDDAGQTDRLHSAISSCEDIGFGQGRIEDKASVRFDGKSGLWPREGCGCRSPAYFQVVRIYHGVNGDILGFAFSTSSLSDRSARKHPASPSENGFWERSASYKRNPLPAGPQKDGV